MLIITWIVGILLLTQFFAGWQDKQRNPNQKPHSATSTEEITVTLQQNKQGHYLSNGLVNGSPATFMLDTGATDVVIPRRLADTYSLPSQGRGQSLTANGIVDVTRTTINSLSIGDITLYNVRASINPGMDKTQPILLGMAALKRLELIQRHGELKLIQRL